MATATKPRAAAPAQSLGSLVDQMWAAREERRKLEEDAKRISEKIEELEKAITEKMDSEGITQTKGARASVSITSSVVADVQDWDTFWPYVAKNKYWHLIQRRVSDPAYRELLDAGKKVPGVQPFTKRKLNLRTI